MEKSNFKLLKRARYISVQASRVGRLFSRYPNTPAKPEKLSFVGDGDLTLFKCVVKLDGLYGPDAIINDGNRFPSIDSALAQEALNDALDKNMSLIFRDMANFIKQGARDITTEAREEIAEGIAILDEIDGG